ncbi:MAG: hypothetical protein JWP03_2129, partial [Phycisphaerales bacterium]|nr:hypothetical protein [Phycisphaerales bacterium]
MTQSYEMSIPAVQPKNVTEGSAPQAAVEPTTNDRARSAQVLERTRHAAALRFLDSVAGWEKYAPQIAA